MNVLIISQCTKNAAVKTCRILDQFAERCGDRAWRTHITQQGLDMVKKLLRRSARKNTAVACHWMRSRDHTELLWIVGDASCFNQKGAVPTNKTQREIIGNQDENDWHTLRDIEILAAIAGLFHDFGKANQAFQNKLTSKTKTKVRQDAYRHEWVSLRLFQAFVNNAKDDKEWLEKLANLNKDSDVEKICLQALVKDGINDSGSKKFFVDTDHLSLAKAIGWLILTHHFLPTLKSKSESESKIDKLEFILRHIDSNWNDARPSSDKANIEKCWTFKTTAFSSDAWCKKANYWASAALKRPQLTKIDWLKDLYSIHLARLSLIIADHYYSGLSTSEKYGDKKFSLYANTDRDKNLNQRLDEHLIGVAENAKKVAHALPLLEHRLPRIKNHKVFKKRTNKEGFLWQNKAYDLAYGLREKTISQGFFGINMASTGCGKTFANGRIMYGLSDENYGARFNIALGLRALTLQTGEFYQKYLELEEDDLAILVGSAAIKELFEISSKENVLEESDNQPTLEARGSESSESFFPDNTYIRYEGSLEIGPLGKRLKEESIRSLVAAPVVVCTVDHLIGATEEIRGGKHIGSMLRLLTSDLVLDEVDDFDIDDLPALSRLVHWAGMLGSRVLLSSATLPPALVQGLFNAYKAGRSLFQKSRGIKDKPANICCAWFDEFNIKTSDHASSESFIDAHKQFVYKRIEKLNKAEVRRRIVVKSLENIPSKKGEEFLPVIAENIHEMLHELHQYHYSTDLKTGKKVSFGLVRFANIDPLIDVAQCLFKLNAHEDFQLRFCCYHARHPLLVRSHIEQKLDYFLNRKEKDKIFEHKELRAILDNMKEDNLIFIVLASPVAEVGRDHDYDWAIVEPSSMRSIIQLAGRVKRHRFEKCERPNIYLLNTNIKSLENSVGNVTYTKPGFEKKDSKFLLNSHDLSDLLTKEEYEQIKAVPRILARTELKPKDNLIDLEHARLKELMLTNLDEGGLISSWWESKSQASLTGVMQQVTRFRSSQPQERYAYLYNEDAFQKEKELEFHLLTENKLTNKHYNFKVTTLNEKDFGDRVGAWPSYGYVSLLRDLAQKVDSEDLKECGERYGWVELDEEKKWCYNPILGLRRKPDL